MTGHLQTGRRRRSFTSFGATMLLGIALLAVSAAGAGTGARSPTSKDGIAPSPGDSYSRGGQMSADGRFVVFESAASTLVPGDTNRDNDAFVRDLKADTAQRVSVGPGGAQAKGWSGGAAISADGRFVAFSSDASNLVAGDTNRNNDVFVRDLKAGTTQRVSVGVGGAQANASSGDAAISADGRFVVFVSYASNLVAGDTQMCMEAYADEETNCADVFVRDRVAETTERVSVGSDGAQGDGSAVNAAGISADGRYVAFTSLAPNLVPGDTNRCTDEDENELSCSDAFVHDRVTGTTDRVSVGTGGVQGSGDSYLVGLTPDGRFVVFESDAANLIAGDTNKASDVFVHDRLSGTTERVSVSGDGRAGNHDSGWGAISADGRFVAFVSSATNLVKGDTNRRLDVFVRDRTAGTTERVSVRSGVQANGDSGGVTALSADGRFVSFESAASNLSVGDTNGESDIYVRDRQARTTTLVSVRRRLPPRIEDFLPHPWPPVAGRAFTVTMPITAGKIAPPAALVRCPATLAGRALHPVAHQFQNGDARCTWRIPSGSSGKRFAASLSADTGEGVARRHFAAGVRTLAQAWHYAQAPRTPTDLRAQPARTLVQLRVPVGNFAQDGPQLAWMTGRCSLGDLGHANDEVVLRAADGGRPRVLARKVCGASGSTGLALAGSRVLYWWPADSGNFTYNDVATAAPGHAARTVGMIVTGPFGASSVPIGTYGDRDTLAYGTAHVDVANDCWSNGGICVYAIGGGGVWRVSATGERWLRSVPTPAALHASAARIAVAPAAGSISDSSGGWTRLNGPVQIRDAKSGGLWTSFSPRGHVVELALADRAAAVLVDRGPSRRIELRDALTGRLVASRRVAGSAQGLDVSPSGTVVFRAGSEIRVLSRTGSRVVARCKEPIGLSIEGNRVAWGENLGHRGRIRAVLLR